MIDEPLVLGLDLGTTVCKAGVYSLEGLLLSSANASITTWRPKSGWAEQNPAEWSDAIVAVLKEVAEQLGIRCKQIRAIGLSAFGPGLILTDKDFQPLNSSPIWQDQRSTEWGEVLVKEVGYDWIHVGMPAISFPAMLAWFINNEKDLVNSAEHILGVKAYMAAFLTGNAAEEPSSGPGSDEWPSAVLDFLGIPPEKLAAIQPSLSSAGIMRPELAEITGLPHDVQVIMGMYDGGTATLGAGVVQEDQGIVSLSTNGVLRTIVVQCLNGDTLIENSLFCWPYVDGMYIAGGFTKCGGDAVRWFLDIAYSDQDDRARQFQLFENDVKTSPPGAKGIVFLPYLAGRGTPGATSNPQGAFYNLARHHTRADLGRAVLEGVSFAIRDIGETFSRLSYGWNNLRFTGSGAGNPIWGQLTADILNKQLTRTYADSVLGAAILAGTAMEFFPGINEAVSAMVKTLNILTPDADTTQYYSQCYRKYQQLGNNLPGNELDEDNNPE